MLVLSLPLCTYAWFREREYFFSSFHGLIVSSFFIDLLAPMQNQISLPILVSALMGGIFGGLGVGLMLRYETSTGGTELLAYFLAKALSLNIGIMILILDGLVVIAGFNVLGLQSFFYSVLTILTFGFMTSLLVNNSNRSHFFY
jgi:uncharacterized membrane-anchored protein YitT (DUF2179 family)